MNSLGHWIEVNDEIMGTLSRFEPPLEVEEKDATFLKLERNQYDLVQCGQSKVSFLCIEWVINVFRVFEQESIPDQEWIWLEQ